MITELIGCAGAGKTTLRRMLCERSIDGRRIVALSDLVLDRIVLRRVTHPTVANVLQEIWGFPYLLGAWPGERTFLAFAREMLNREGVSQFDRLNGLRGVMRKVGMHHLAKSCAPNAVVIADEGAVLSAYNLFMPGRRPFVQDDIERFVRHVPLPDRIVYIRASVDTLIERAALRPDTRRQHVGKTRAGVEVDVRRTVELFDRIAVTPRIRNRLIEIENPDADEAQRRRLAAEIARSLRAAPPAPAFEDPAIPARA